MEYIFGNLEERSRGSGDDGMESCVEEPNSEITADIKSAKTGADIIRIVSNSYKINNSDQSENSAFITNSLFLNSQYSGSINTTKTSKNEYVFCIFCGYCR